MIEKVNIICMKWGILYDFEYVNKLYNSVKRNLTKEFSFHCFTDNRENIHHDIICHDLPIMYVPDDKKISPWLKLAVYEYNFANLSGRTLFLDLDIVIIDNIDCLFNFSERYSIAENWTQIGQDIGNSSVFCFNIGEHRYIYDDFVKNAKNITSQYDNEQIYSSKSIGNQKDFYPKNWIISFKKHCIYPGIKRFFYTPIIPNGAKIIAFHGHPKPTEAANGIWPKKIIPFMKKADWINKYWY